MWKHVFAFALAMMLFSQQHPVQGVATNALMPSSMPQWHGPANVFQGRPRYWNQTVLDKGIHSIGDLAHFKRFFDKLNSGKRIVAVAFGSSFVHDFAGCWQPSLEALWDLGIVPNPVRAWKDDAAEPRSDKFGVLQLA
jgi:hypothetical protein